MGNQLYRSRVNRQLSGVCGGIGEYFGIDPTVIRLIWVLFTLTFGLGLIVYIIAAIVIPEVGSYNNSSYGAGQHGNESYNGEPIRPVSFDPGKSTIIIGSVLIICGVLALAKHYVRWIDFSLLWPIGFIALGALIVYNASRRN